MSFSIKSGVVTNLVQTSKALLSNSSLGVKVLCATTLLGYGLSYSQPAIEALSVTPGYFLPPHFYLWTAVTHCYLEIHWWEVAVDLVTLILVGKLLEPLWGALEMITFFFVVNAGVGVFSAVFYYFLYMVTFNEQLLFQVHIHGLAGYLAGVSVAVKQAMPDHILYRTPMGFKFTNRNIPLSVFGLSFIMWAVGLVEGSYCTMFGSGLVISWIYLRFYQLHANGSRGDTADGFAFANFFPNVIQPPIAGLGNLLFALLVKVRICRRPIRRYDVGGGALAGGNTNQPSISISLPGVDNHDTERRRQIALKALSDRLNKAAGAPGSGGAGSNSGGGGKTAWPSMDTSSDREPLLPPTVAVHSNTTTPTPTVEDRGATSPVAEDAVLVDIADAAADEPVLSEDKSLETV